MPTGDGTNLTTPFKLTLREDRSLLPAEAKALTGEGATGDLVQRLQHAAAIVRNTFPKAYENKRSLYDEALDGIWELETQLADWKQAVAVVLARAEKAEAEVERLKRTAGEL